MRLILKYKMILTKMVVLHFNVSLIAESSETPVDSSNAPNESLLM